MTGNMEIMYSQISGCIFLLSQDHNKMKQASHLFTASLRVMLQLKNSRGKSLLCFLPLITDNISSPFYRIIGYLKELRGWKEPLKTTQPSPTHDQLGFKQLLGESPLPYFNTLRVKKSSCMYSDVLSCISISVHVLLSFQYSVSLAIPLSSVYSLIRQ